MKSNITLRVLIVEDDTAVLDTMREIFTMLGARAVGVSNPHCALTVIPEFNPHLIVLDHGLPGMSGLELIGKLREVAPHVQICMATASACVDLAVKAMKAGASDFIPKPFDLTQLERIMADAIKRIENMPTLREVERQHIERVTRTCETASLAAKRLGICPSTLWRKQKAG